MDRQPLHSSVQQAARRGLIGPPPSPGILEDSEVLERACHHIRLGDERRSSPQTRPVREGAGEVGSDDPTYEAGEA